MKVFYFFVRNLSKIIWRALASYPVTFNPEQASFFSMPWQIVILLFLNSGLAYGILSFVLSVSWNISENSFTRRFSTNLTSSKTFSSFLSRPLPIYVSKRASTKLIRSHTWSLEQGNTNVPTVRYFFPNIIYSWFIVYFQCYHFSFLCCIFIFVGWFSWLSIL